MSLNDDIENAVNRNKRFLHDGTDVIADLDASGAVTRRFIHGPGVDEPVAMYIGTGDTTRRFYVTDPLGSVIGLTAANGDLKARHSYSAYGIPDDADIAAGNPYRYTARRWDEETGLYYYRARYYSPTLGRFLSPDPIGYGDGLNLYAYVGNDPVNLVDPSGTKLYPGGATSGASFSLVQRSSFVQSSFDDSGSFQQSQALGLCTAGPVGCVGGIGITAGQILFGGTAVGTGIGAGILLNESSKDKPGTITPRPDLPPLSGGRSGQKVKGLTGPPSSAIRGTGKDRIFITDEDGNVILDVQPGRTKPVTPGKGFGDKRPPTQQELDLLDKLR